MAPLIEPLHDRPYVARSAFTVESARQAIGAAERGVILDAARGRAR